MDKPQSDDAPQGVEEVLGELDELAAGQPRVCIGDVLDDFGKRSFGLFILIPPLIELSPIGGIPGVPTFLALIIGITAVQLFLGKDHVWMPQFIQQRAVSGRRLHRALMKLRGIAHWLDERSHGRLENLTQGVWTRVAAVAIVVLCCTVPPLEFIPFASSAPMLAIAAFGLAITVRDGALMLVALTLAAAALGAGGYLLATNPIG
ncbi:MAG TPA: exopolysaccharide biosynthesis protein [Qipengyuania sp.]|nr:exopolysaccharide biosynthesis protein [Qipengyuania sp.]